MKTINFSFILRNIYFSGSHLTLFCRNGSHNREATRTLILGRQRGELGLPKVLAFVLCIDCYSPCRFYSHHRSGLNHNTGAAAAAGTTKRIIWSQLYSIFFNLKSKYNVTRFALKLDQSHFIVFLSRTETEMKNPQDYKFF